MITIPIEFIIVLFIIIAIIIYSFFEVFILRPFNYYVRGKRLYKYEKIYSSGGIGTEYKWCKSDELALLNYDWYEFVDCVYPEKHCKKIKPNDSN